MSSVVQISGNRGSSDNNSGPPGRPDAPVVAPPGGVLSNTVFSLIDAHSLIDALSLIDAHLIKNSDN